MRKWRTSENIESPSVSIVVDFVDQRNASSCRSHGEMSHWPIMNGTEYTTTSTQSMLTNPPSSCCRTWTCKGPFHKWLCFQWQENSGRPWEVHFWISEGAVEEGGWWVLICIRRECKRMTYQLKHYIDYYRDRYESTQCSHSCEQWALRQQWPYCMVYAWHG